MAIHEFKPAHYHRTFGPHEPALRIAPGDTVVTSTVDAAGGDATGQEVTEGGNPQTGPFYVEGAEPGDTLVVELDAVEPNRDTGFSGGVLAANVVDPWFVSEMPKWQRIDWLIDRAGRAARPANPPAGLENLVLPLAPMLGCIAVCPGRGQAISTATSAEFGGNMDYRGFVAGVTVYFPVFVPGALFHLGDGHALQGDGELAGTGVETSMDVRFTVRLLKGKQIYWPRGEDEEFIFTVGNARPLDQALQHATTAMLHWLANDYGLDGLAAGTLLGQCACYDLGNVFDPAYTMVCKVPKAVLRQLAGEV